MRWKEAVDYLAVKSRLTDNIRVRNTLFDLHGVLRIAGASDGERWASKVETVVAYVEAGHYTGTYEDARKLFNKRKYPMPEQ